MSGILGADLAVVDGDLAPASNGDAALVTGTDALGQRLAHLLSTPRGTLWMHPRWGFDLWRFIHVEDLAVHRLDFRQSVQEAVEEDPQVVPGSARCAVESWGPEGVVRFLLTVRVITETHPLNLVLVANTAAGTVEAIGGDA